MGKNGAFRGSFWISVLILVSALRLEADIIWVAPNGSDTGSGSNVSPYATLRRAQKNIKPGDTVCIRGGIYKMRMEDVTVKSGGVTNVIVLDKSGTKQKPIRYWAYPNERPIFDFSDIKPKDTRVTAFFVSGSWIHLRGFETIGVQVMIKDHTQSINFENEGSDNIYENLAMHDGQGIGFYLTLGERNLVLNCDAYRNYDYTSENGRGGNSDGFGCHSRKPGEPNVFQGCRSWFNSDDGYDCINSASPVIFRDCWAFYNGFSPDFKRRADGNGFKAGGYGTTPASRLPDPIPQHRVEGCLSVRNASSGFYANHHLVGGIWLNNTAYRNSTDFNMLMRQPGNGEDMPGVGHVLKNNLSYQGKKDLAEIDRSKCVLEKNSFDLNLSFKDSDFLGVDEGELIAPRKLDGGLPDIKFLHPTQRKDIVDQGVDVGRAYVGKAPDIGAFEFVPKTGVSGL